MRDNVWKLTDCADVWLSSHDCNSWRSHPHAHVHTLTLTLVCTDLLPEHWSRILHGQADRQMDTYTPSCISAFLSQLKEAETLARC